MWSSIGRPLYHKNKCVYDRFWQKNHTRKTGKLMRISTLSRWREFKRHTININDALWHVRLSELFEAVSALLDLFAADRMYHLLCWRDYISSLHFGPKEAVHLQSETYSEMKQMFFKKVDQIIFAEHEIWSLQSLLQEYKQIVREYRFDMGNFKLSYCEKSVS